MPPASLVHTRTRPHTWGSVQSPQPRWAWLTWQSGVEATRGSQASRRLRGSASVSLAASVNPRRRKSALLPAPARPAPAPSVFCVVNTEARSPQPQGGGSIEEIEPQAHNWKPDRLAGVNGARYTRCAKKKETIMQRPGRRARVSLEAFNPYPPVPLLTSLLPPLPSAPDPGWVMPQGPRSVLQHHLSSGKEWEPGYPKCFMRQCLGYHRKSRGNVSFIHF